MFKKILLTIIILSPLAFLFIGYPIQKVQPNTAPLATSQRCFVIGNPNQFVRCFSGHQRLGGIQLANRLAVELDSLQPSFGFLFVGFFLLQIVLLLTILLRKPTSIN